MGASPMPMPYALCPMPYEHLMLLRKAISWFGSCLKQHFFWRTRINLRLGIRDFRLLSLFSSSVSSAPLR
ncbi:hypothetical protein [Microcoleus sp.]|uniref:hypothetical protein n=1 Tax=Microcoleus sp. TaxID=44472 RepID=UPI00403EDF45